MKLFGLDGDRHGGAGRPYVVPRMRGVPWPSIFLPSLQKGRASWVAAWWVGWFGRNGEPRPRGFRGAVVHRLPLLHRTACLRCHTSFLNKPAEVPNLQEAPLHP